MRALRKVLWVCLFTTCGLASAQIEWPVLHSMRSVSFTEALVLQCNEALPSEAGELLSAFRKWKILNEGQASALRVFNLERMHREMPNTSIGELEVELDSLQATALAMAAKDVSMCRNLKQWLNSTDSEPRRQVLDIMQPPSLMSAPR